MAADNQSIIFFNIAENNQLHSHQAGFGLLMKG